MKRTVALVTCAANRNGGDPDEQFLLDALREQSIDAIWVEWDDPDVEWNNFALSVVRSTWDYVGRRKEFLAWAASVPRLCNPSAVLEENTDKRYLAALASRGVLTVPTSFVAPGEAPVFPEGPFVVKPAVGAGSMDAARYSELEHEAAAAHVRRLHESGRAAMVQPYVLSVDELGETALIFIDGEFSHAMNKGAMLNTTELAPNSEFRDQQMRLIAVDDETVQVGRTVFAAAGVTDLLYGRVDLVATNEGLALMELELTEPSLFLSFEPEAATRLAQAIRRRLDRGRPN